MISSRVWYIESRYCPEGEYWREHWLMQIIKWISSATVKRNQLVFFM